MTNLTMRVLGWLRSRPRHDDRGLETAEVLMWMALTAGVIGVLSGQLNEILEGVMERIRGLLG